MKLKWLGLVLLLGLAPALASGAEQANAPTATGETGLFTLLTGDTLPRGGWSFGLYYNNWDPLVDIRDFPLRKVDDMSVDYHRLDASFGYGITDRWEISVAVPYEKYHFAFGDLGPGFGGGDNTVDGLGNIRIGTKFRLLGSQGDPSTLALNLFVEPATGDDEVASDETGFGGGLGWRLNKWVIDVGYRDPGDDFPTELHGGIGYVAPISDRLDWITEVVGTFYDGDNGSFNEFEDRYDFTTGGRLWLGEEQEWAFNFALRTDLAQLSEIDDHCPLGGLLGFTYFPRLVRHEPPPPPPPPPAPEPPPPPPPPAPEPPPPPAPPPPPPPPPAPPERMEVTCDFTSGSARLTNICKAKLDEVGLRMKQDPDATAQVTGYSNGAKGSSASNQKVADQRAQGVKNYLVTRHGIDPSRIQTQGQVTDSNTAVVVITIP